MLSTGKRLNDLLINSGVEAGLVQHSDKTRDNTSWSTDFTVCGRTISHYNVLLQIPAYLPMTVAGTTEEMRIYRNAQGRIT